MPKIRKPAVAGQFYPATGSAIRKLLSSFLDKEAVAIDCISCLLPHAGYVYSGEVATQTLQRIKIKKNIILLGPNHTGNGAPFSIMTEGLWETPLGQVKINTELARSLLKNSGYLKEDTLAHAEEHSLEVELPIMQYFRSDFEIVPIAFMSNDLQALKTAGKQIGEVIEKSGLKNSVLLAASSDMTHFEPQPQAKSKDNAAIEAILRLSEDQLAEKIKKLRISMCGYAPAIVMLSAAKILGATQAKLVKYMTSGDTTGDLSSVVGYAGIIIY